MGTPQQETGSVKSADFDVGFLKAVLGRVATLPIETLLDFSLPATGRKLEETCLLEVQCDAARNVLVRRLHDLVPQVQDRNQRRQVVELKRKIFGSWQAIGEKDLIVIRAVLAPELLDHVETFNGLLKKRASLLEESRRELVEGTRNLRTQFLELMADPFFKETVALSSQKLLEAMERYQRNPPQEHSSKRQRQVERSLMEHLARCCAKTSPRSILTAVHLGKTDRAIAKDFHLQRGDTPYPILRKKVLLSLPVVRMIADRISENEEIWPHVIPRPNPTLHIETGTGRLKFWVRIHARKESSYGAHATPLMEAFLEAVRPRELKAHQLLAQMAKRFPDHSPAELRDYYHKLGKLGILRTRLEIPFANIDGLDYLLNWLRALPQSVVLERMIGEFSLLQEEIRRLEDLSLKSPEKDGLYGRIGRLVSRYTPHPLSQDRYLVVDSVAAWENLELGRGFLDNFKQALQVYDAFAAGENFRQNNMSRIIERLRLRFPNQIEIGALETYAPDLTGKPIWRDRERTSPRQLLQDSILERRIRWLMELIEKRTSSTPGIREIRLTLDDLKSLSRLSEIKSSNSSQLRSGAMFVHIAQRPGADNYRIIIEEILNGTCSRNISRWAHLFQEQGGLNPIEESLSRYYADIGRAAWQNRIAAVLFQSETKTDTAGWHPSFHRYEIETNGPPSNYPIDRVVPLRDIYFKLDANDSLSIHTRRAGLSGAIFPLYEGLQSIKDEPMIGLLSFVTFSKLKWINFRPEMLLAEEFGALPRHLPRLIIGSVVLCRETWVFRAQALQIRRESDQAEACIAFNRWRLREGMPRFLFIHSCNSFRLNKPYFVDSYNPFLVGIWLSALMTLNPETEVWFREMSPHPGEFWTRDRHGHYAHELTVAFYSSAATTGTSRQH